MIRQLLSIPHSWRIRQRSVLVAIILLSLILRAWRLRQGLPDFLDEAIPFKQALEMWGWETGRLDLNPHFFNYPTLAIYLHFLVQHLFYEVGALAGRFTNPNDLSLFIDIDPTGPVVAARLLGFAADAVSVWMAWRLGERLLRGAGPLAALLVALSPVFIVTARAIHVDSIMTALFAAAVERLLAWRQDGGTRRLTAAVVLIGLATGAKYNAGVLVVPLAWVLWNRAGWRGLRSWPPLTIAAFAVFVLSSPWVALDFEAFLAAISAEFLHMKEGHLGVTGATGTVHYLKRLLADPGPVGLLLLPLALVKMRKDATSRGASIALWLTLLPLLSGLLVVRMEADRYLEPLLILVAPLIATATFAACAQFPWRRMSLLVPLAVLAPVLLGGLRAATAGGDTTQQQARRWCEAHLGNGELLVQEAYGTKLLTPFQKDAIRRSRYFAVASEDMQARYLARRTYNAVSLPMATSGRLEVRLARDSAAALRLTVFPQASDLNQSFYDPRLFDGVDYVLVSGAMRHRYAADPKRFAAQNRFYAWLASGTEVAATFTPGGDVAGPQIVVYRLGESFWRDLRSRELPLDPFWWARAVPSVYRQEVELALAAPGRHSGDECVTAEGQPAAWVLSLRGIFDEYVIPFELQIGTYLAERNLTAQARRHAATILATAPEIAAAARLFSYCALTQGDLEAARRQIETTLLCRRRLGMESADLQEELTRLGTADAAHNAGQSTPRSSQRH